ncbi:hypothetical protein QTP70_015223 [Hemibagrus guttatus]|uniref:Ig-like domain-containing protein n=1 Tax=Hemibagrus guttatus TaxID=175788 RepID=A0AAE0V2S7_9TELE|nr:hypothetical protein QTP70_015223 [Hemibagrus guttatus]
MANPCKVHIKPPNLNMPFKDGDTVRFQCATSAACGSYPHWQLGDLSEPPIEKDSVDGEKYSELNLALNWKYDGKTLTCHHERVYDPCLERSVTLIVEYAPKGVNISPTNNNLIEGDELTLTCVVQDSKPAVEVYSYRWYKDGQEINHQTTKTFTVRSVTQSHKGDYECKAKNSVGETKSTDVAKVFVRHVPHSTYINGISGIKLGFQLNLQCNTVANPPPEIYYWYFKPEHKQQFLMLSNIYQVYYIEKVAVSNAGVYVCSAKNNIGTGANSSEVNVLVYYSPKKPNLAMKQVVKENEIFSITCTVESSPQAELILSRSSLTNSGKDKILLKNFQANFLNLTLKASVSDAGVYTCSAKNSEGENSSDDHLKVLYAPKNVKASAYPGEELKEGSELRLTCKADSVPQVSAYTWKKNFGARSLVVGHEPTLTIRPLMSADSDHYFCITRNEIGSTESPTIFIRVKYQPQITIIHNMTSMGLFEEAVPVHLSCSVQCYPPATSFAWYKLEENTLFLSNDQNYTVQPQNPGMYYCEASNEMGNSISEPVKINNYSIIQLLIKIVISLLVILFLIGVLFLLQRIMLKKRCSGTNEAAQQSFFSSAVPLWSNLRSSGSRNNITNNLVMEGSSEIFGYRDNQSSTRCSRKSPSQQEHTSRKVNHSSYLHILPNYDIQTTYDVLKLPPNKLKQERHSEEDLTTVNYAMLQFMDSNKPNKSVSSRDSGDPDYAKVIKKKQMPNEHLPVFYAEVAPLVVVRPCPGDRDENPQTETGPGYWTRPPGGPYPSQSTRYWSRDLTCLEHTWARSHTS